MPFLFRDEGVPPCTFKSFGAKTAERVLSWWCSFWRSRRDLLNGVFRVSVPFMVLEIHLIWFIRDAALERLVSSLKYPPFYTRSVSYSSLIFWTNPYSLSLISYQPQKIANRGITISEMSVMHGEIFEYWILLSFHIKLQWCVQTQFCLTYQIASGVLQISVISYFLRGD